MFVMAPWTSIDLSAIRQTYYNLSNMYKRSDYIYMYVKLCSILMLIRSCCVMNISDFRPESMLSKKHATIKSTCVLQSIICHKV